MNFKLLITLVIACILITGCGKSDEEKKKEAIAGFGYGTKADSYPEPSHSKF